MFKRKILVVDDQEINRRILGKILANEYSVLYGANGQEAMEIMRTHTDISAVILDIMMPVMNGYEVLKAMTDDQELAKIPVIVSSQKDGDEAELKALSLGANDFVAKPYKSTIIHRRLGNIIKLRETAAMINKSERDELTGVYNKQFFLDRVREILQNNKGESFDMLCLGVERFKLVNDTYGEDTGDKVLRHIAQVLVSSRQEHMLIGRFMQDEFYVLMPHKEQQDELLVKEWIKEINEYPIDMEIRIHCGIYPITGYEDSVNNICDSAKLAADDNRGKFDKVFSYYDDSIRKKILEEQFVLSNMQDALQKHQFKVYYQPKYDLNTELIIGAEALIRWEHPTRGLISPGKFIPIFEKNGFITTLDKYVWETVCQDIAHWKETGYDPISVSVNVSRVDIYSPTLVDDILDLVAKYKININQLHLEITESAYTDNPDQIISVIKKFRDLGFIIEMDDFGSGYSSLNMLAKMPVDVLKLDMKFVQTEQESVNGKVIMSFVISLARWMNLVVIAEGVETSEQIAMLRNMDCTYVQGFFYARPMHREDFEKLMQSSQVASLECRKIKDNMVEYVENKDFDEKKLVGREMLIVDDMEVNREVLASIFINEYVIVKKSNGKEAWDYLEANVDKVDIVMLDLMMPVMDGFQLLKKIRENEATEKLAVIITSQSNPDSEQMALDLKADDYVSKPYRADLIRHRVHNVAPKLKPHIMPGLGKSFDNFVRLETDASLSINEKIDLYVAAQKPHFDLVRLVQPEQTMVCEQPEEESCQNEFCYSVWGKMSRCNNCVSMRALRSKGRCCKLEYAHNTLHFVISEYVPYGEYGAVVEMVTKLDNEYIDNMFEKDLLYLNLDELQHQIEFDALTGVYNRRHIDKHLTTYIEMARRHHKNLGLAMVDVDSFKILNDKHGHLAGDAALKDIANILQSNIAISKGDFVARYGGDEFMIVCRDIPRNIFKQRMEAIVQVVRHLEINPETKEAVGISIGCVSVDEFPTISVMDLIKTADTRLYRAKSLGKNCLVAE